MFGFVFKTIKLAIVLSILIFGGYILALMYDKVPPSLTPQTLLADNVVVKKELLMTAQSDSLMSGTARKVYNYLYTPPLPEPVQTTDPEGNMFTNPINKAKEAVQNYNDTLQKQKQELDDI